ncbi:TonB-dependent receptor [Tsuneonella rigui]|uniref:TonB-dependent receptor n=1 Tax=Tsuneonella rigui TaxID=1708790 RepID=UPI000F7EA571|nr:TonB-dependent receptor [Tsuneonella rigui]
MKVRFNRTHWLSSAVSAVALCASFPSLAQDRPDGDEQQPSSAGAAADAKDQAEIIVTASKREERLQDVPATVTALTGDTIENLGVRDFRDYATLVPGLSQRDLGAPGLGTIILRGLNTGPQQTTNTASFYIDDAPFSPSGFLSVGSEATPSPDLADIERIEVLKGPQGTLYGASSLGGLVRVITKKADPSRLFGMAQLEAMTVAHGDEGWAARAAVNIPLIANRVAVRVSGFYRHAPGWIDNVTTGERDINSSIIKGGRIALHADVSDRLALDLAGFYQDIDNNGGSGQANVKGTTRPLYGKYKIGEIAGTGGSDIRYRSASGTATYDTDAGAVVATAAYVKSATRFIEDYTPSYGNYLSLFGIVPVGTQIVGQYGPELEKFTSELRFVSKRLGPVEFVAGGFYTWENSQYPFGLLARDATGTPLPAPLDEAFFVRTHSKYQEYAAFGDLTFYLTDRLDVTGGIRFAHNNQTVSQDQGTVFYGPYAANSTDFSDNATTYLATVRYRPSDQLSFYARAASGYRPGGPQTATALLPPNAQSEIRSDSVWNYEAGVKASSADGTFSGSAALYHIDWTDIQLNTIFGGITLQGNAGKAEVDGFELELLARPSANFTAGANVGRTNARITSIDAAAAGSLGASSGDKLPLTPGWTVAAFADHNVPFSDRLAGTFGGTVRFQSDMPSGYPGSASNPSIKVPSVTTVDLRAGLEMEGYSLQLRVDNLFDTLGYTSLRGGALYPGQPVPTIGTTIRPRAVTLSATARF